MGIQPSGISQNAGSTDQANAVVSGQFTANGQVSGTFVAWGPFNVVFGGTGGPNGNWNATIQLERTFDGGTTWFVCGVGGAGQQAIYSTNNQDVSLVVGEPEKGVGYRLRVTAYTSGTINYRISTTGGTAMSLAVASAI